MISFGGLGKKISGLIGKEDVDKIQKEISLFLEEEYGKVEFETEIDDDTVDADAELSVDGLSDYIYCYFSLAEDGFCYMSVDIHNIEKNEKTLDLINSYNSKNVMPFYISDKNMLILKYVANDINIERFKNLIKNVMNVILDLPDNEIICQLKNYFYEPQE